jgi:hypothetical protein
VKDQDVSNAVRASAVEHRADLSCECRKFSDRL